MFIGLENNLKCLVFSIIWKNEDSIHDVENHRNKVQINWR